MGLLTDEGRVDASRLDEFSGELVNHPGVGEWWRAFDIHLLAHSLEEGVGLLGVELLVGRELLSGSPLELGALNHNHQLENSTGRAWGDIHHLDSPPWCFPVHIVDFTVLGGELGLVGAGELLDKRRNQLFSQGL